MSSDQAAVGRAGGDGAAADSSKEPRPWATAPLLFVALAFLYRLAWEVVSGRRSDYDERLFLNVAQAILRSGLPIHDYGLTTATPFFDHTPLYEYLMAPVVAIGNALGGRSLELVRIETAIFGLGTVALVFLVARDVRGTVAGLIAGLLVATNPYFVQYSWFIHMEVPMSFFLVLGLYLIVHERILAAGLAIAAAVLLKEIALGFWFVAGTYVLLRRGWRKAALIALPAAVAFVGWLLIAWRIDEKAFLGVVQRWVNSVGGASTWDKRFRIALRAWTRMIALDIIGVPITIGGIAAVGLALGRRTRIPSITFVPVAYSILAVGVTFLIHFREERWLMAVIPMSALVVALLVDWASLVRWLTRLDDATVDA